jgi:peptidoglycan/LPS O-acetylase OafA/YrhL
VDRTGGPDPHAVSERPPTTGRVVELDALRGLAALAVLGFHYLVLYPRIFDTTLPVPPLIVYGEYGVELFFIISGFVIYLTMEHRSTVRSFAFARFARLYPVYWAALAVTFLVTRAWPIPNSAPTPTEVLINLTMFGGFFKVTYVDSAYWSLTVELGFYLTMAALLALRRIHRALEVVFGIALLYMVVNVINRFESTHWIQVPIEAHLRFIRYAHLFAAGIAFYLYFVKGRRNPLVYAAVIMTPVIGVIDGGLVSGIVVGFVVVIFWIAVAFRPGVLRWRPLLLLGGISYALYLVHQYVGYVIISRLDERGVNHWVSVGVATAASLGLAAGLTFAVERPARAWLRNRRRDPVESAVGGGPGPR